MAAHTETYSHFSQGSALGSGGILGGRRDLRIAPHDFWSWPSEESMGFHDGLPDLEPDSDRHPAFLHYQSPLEFKIDILHAQGIDSHENTILYGLLPPPPPPPPPVAPAGAHHNCNNDDDDVLWENRLSKGTASSPACKRAEATRLTSCKRDLAHKPAQRQRQQATATAAASHVPRQAPAPTSLLASKAAVARNHGDGPQTHCPRRRPVAAADAVADAKQQRKRLSAEQKRRNHIRHETKRRGLIKDGFDCLVDAVPELRGRRNWPKSAILSKTTEFLRTMQEGNRKLQMQVAQLSSINNIQGEGL